MPYFGGRALTSMFIESKAGWELISRARGSMWWVQMRSKPLGNTEYKFSHLMCATPFLGKTFFPLHSHHHLEISPRDCHCNYSYWWCNYREGVLNPDMWLWLSGSLSFSLNDRSNFDKGVGTIPPRDVNHASWEQHLIFLRVVALLHLWNVCYCLMTASLEFSIWEWFRWERLQPI